MREGKKKEENWSKGDPGKYEIRALHWKKKQKAWRSASSLPSGDRGQLRGEGGKSL